MKIGVLGTGDVGKVLSAGFLSRGHEVVIGTREAGAEPIRKWLSDKGKGVAAGSFAEAAAFGEVVVMAVGWSHVRAVIELAGPATFAGKVVMDAVNPLRFEAEGRPPVLDIGFTDSAGEQIQRWLPDAKVVKAFNIIGHLHMVDPSFPDGAPDMFICGGDDGAKRTVSSLVEQLGWPAPVDLGGIEQSRLLEPLAMVWITHLFRNGFNPNHAIKLLKK